MKTAAWYTAVLVASAAWLVAYSYHEHVSSEIAYRNAMQAYSDIARPCKRGK